MTHRDSSYYPRRATFFSPLFAFFDSFKRRLPELSFHMPEEVSLFGLVGGVAVPGWAVYLRHRDRSGRAALGLCALLILVFFIFLGYPAGNTAFTVLLCLHLVGLMAYCRPLLAEMQWPGRLFVGGAISVLIIACIYMPIRSWISERFFLPLRLHDRVVVVQRLSSPTGIHRGDWIAFQVSATQDYFNIGIAHGSVLIHNGVNLGEVLAVPGDHVKFTKDRFVVNGVARPTQAWMPTQGEWDVPEKCWFVWPDFSRMERGNVPSNTIAEAIMQVARVTPDRYIGKAFAHWFGRRQHYS